MAFRPVILAAAALALCALPATTSAYVKLQSYGKREYQANCATCHGPDGRGNGPWADLLDKAPPDLTRLAQRNRGMFPARRVHQLIDGRHDPRPQHVREMPAWGAEYAAWGSECVDPETYARVRITALVEYLRRLQTK